MQLYIFSLHFASLLNWTKDKRILIDVALKYVWVWVWTVSKHTVPCIEYVYNGVVSMKFESNGKRHGMAHSNLIQTKSNRTQFLCQSSCKWTVKDVNREIQFYVEHHFAISFIGKIISGILNGCLHTRSVRSGIDLKCRCIQYVYILIKCVWPFEGFIELCACE